MKDFVITWTEEDIRMVIADQEDTDFKFSDEDIEFVLEAMEESHDANFGISWDTVEYWLNRVREG